MSIVLQTLTQTQMSVLSDPGANSAHSLSLPGFKHRHGRWTRITFVIDSQQAGLLALVVHSAVLALISCRGDVEPPAESCSGRWTRPALVAAWLFDVLGIDQVIRFSNNTKARNGYSTFAAVILGTVSSVPFKVACDTAEDLASALPTRALSARGSFPSGCGGLAAGTPSPTTRSRSGADAGNIE